MELERIETGPIQFENDWPGIFIRGDEALAIRLYLHFYIQDNNNILAKEMCKAFIKTLASCNVPNELPLQETRTIKRNSK